MIVRRPATDACETTAISGSMTFSTGCWQCPTFSPRPRWPVKGLIRTRRAGGSASPLELRLLQAIRTGGLPEPLKQHEVYDAKGRLFTRAHVAYTTPRRILIYADGLECPSALRLRIDDTRQSNQLQGEGWHVLRFLGPHVYRRPDDCVAQARDALGL
jgi:hypothetical protein